VASSIACLADFRSAGWIDDPVALLGAVHL
jgi:hypothetical protein